MFINVVGIIKCVCLFSFKILPFLTVNKKLSILVFCANVKLEKSKIDIVNNILAISCVVFGLAGNVRGLAFTLFLVKIVKFKEEKSRSELWAWQDFEIYSSH